ncbi:coiled-coil domain-containing protein 73 [Paramisgurnus dabryanus]|uniref:coiled-coil domain-containing protein 73 n=1 Tax=Paramisgurnus dabryanus TaxID=90735 RepID=UPI0031F36FBF
METEKERFCLMEDKSALGQPKTPNISPESNGRSISVHVLEFKASLLEAVEELHIRRDAETRYEEQICKLMLENPELEWEKESLQNQISKMSNENSESLAAVKKQFQAQIRGLEGEKGKIQLAAELKDKEITSLKEELKSLQLLRYSLEKKLAELEQKLQLQTQLKDSHLNQLGEVERRFVAVSRQCTAFKQAHEQLEQNVEEAMRINKKLTSINEKQESTIKALKEDLERLNKELAALKVSSVRRPGEEHLQHVLKEQQLQQFQQRLFVETELNKKLRNETATEREEKQEVLRSLQHTQRLLQTQTEALSQAEQELITLREEYKLLKAEHELDQERTREDQERFTRLKDEFQNSKLDCEKKMLLLQKTSEADQVELKAVKEAYNLLQEENKLLSASVDHNIEDIQDSEINLEDQALVNRTITDSFYKNESLEIKEGLNSDDGEPARRFPDESSADCQRNKVVGGSHDKSSSMQLDPLTDVSPSTAPLDSQMSEKISGPEEVIAVTNQLSNLCAETKPIVCESETVCSAVDKGCPSNQARSDTDCCLPELSGPETRSVYEVDGDPLALEQKDGTLGPNLCISEVTEPQTSDKHIDGQKCGTKECREIKDESVAPEFLQSRSQTEDQASMERLPGNKMSDVPHVTENGIVHQPNPCQETTQQEPDALTGTQTLLEDHNSPPEFISTHSQAVGSPGANFDEVDVVESKHLPLIASTMESADHNSPPELISTHLHTVGSAEANLDEVNMVKTKQVPLIAGTMEPILPTASPSMETVAISKNKDQKHDPVESVSLLSNITNPSQDHSSPDGFHKAKDQSDVDHKCMSVASTSNNTVCKRYRSCFAWNSFIKDKMNTQPKCAESKVDHSVQGTRNSKLGLAPTPLKSQHRSSGFHGLEFVSPFSAPRFTKNKAVMRTPDRLDAPTKRPHQKSDFRGEWNAIKQSFSEMLAEKDNRVFISYSSTMGGNPGSSSVGNGLRQDGTPTVSPPKLQSLETDLQPEVEGGTANYKGKEEQNQSDTVAQIANIEERMNSTEGLTPQKIRKIE